MFPLTVRRTFALLALTGAVVGTGFFVPTAAQAAGCASPRLASVTAPATPVVGGTAAVVRADLTCAPRADVTLAVSSGGSVAAPPRTVRVKAGRIGVAFSVPTKPVARLTAVLINAQLGGGLVRSGTLRLLPPCPAPQAAAVSLSSATAHSGDRLTGTVRLSCAPTGGPATVRLSAAPASALTVPATVQVPLGSKEAAFTVDAAAVSGRTQAVLTAAVGGRAASGSLRVDPGLKNFGGTTWAVGGRGLGVWTNLTGSAPEGGTTVALSSSSSMVKVPATTSVPSGGLGSTFSVDTLPVQKETPVTLTAKIGTVSRSFTAVLAPEPFDPGSWDLAGPYALLVGTSHEYTVTIANPAPAGGLRVSLTDENGVPWVHLPGEVVIPAGSTSATFAVDVDEDAPTGWYDGPSITASIFDAAQRTVQPAIIPRVESVTGLPETVEGGTSFEVTVNFTSGSERGLSVNVVSDDAAVRVPAADEWGNVGSSGETSVLTFTVTTEPVAVDTPVKLRLSYPGRDLTIPLLVTAPGA